MSHTKGPWRVEEAEIVEETGEYQEAKIWADGDGTDAKPDRHIATIRVGLSGSEDNARLIAAAPDLLEALKAILPAVWGDGIMEHIPGVRLARSAIAKAEGWR